MRRRPGKREGKLAFDVGQGSQDLGFRNEVDILFTVIPSAKVTLRVLDSNDKPTTAVVPHSRRTSSVSIHRRPSASRRTSSFTRRSIAPTANPSRFRPGSTRSSILAGPSTATRKQTLTIKDTTPLTLTFRLERWIDPAKMGWYSGDHHIHAAGCAHYERPTEGVYPQDMMRHVAR